MSVASHADAQQDYLISLLIQEQTRLRQTLDKVNATLATLIPSGPPKTMDREQLAEFIHVSPATISNWIALRKIPYHKANGAVFFVVDEIMRWSAEAAERRNGRR